jgi:hypothetical protein
MVIMVERDTISANSRTACSPAAQTRSCGSTFANVVSGVAAASGGIVHSYKNNAINGNVVDETPITQEILN